MKTATVLLAGLTFLIAVVSNGQAATDYVVIDTREAAYTVYAGITADKVESVKARAAETRGIAVVTPTDFANNSHQYVKARIVKDDYPASGVVEAMIDVVRKNAGVPVAVTWNGGVALTFNDYRYARRTFEVYREDPAAYERTRNRDPRTDPVNPSNHLPYLLSR